MENYDSTQDTLLHRALVAKILRHAADELLKRGQVHDESKLYPPEKPVFDAFTPKLRELEYGTDAYRETLRQMRPAMDHHYAENTHHPEHWYKGIDGMTMLDLLEMLADWWAAGQRHESSMTLEESIKHNQGRFGYSDAMVELMIRTGAELGWY